MSSAFDSIAYDLFRPIASHGMVELSTYRSAVLGLVLLPTAVDCVEDNFEGFHEFFDSQ